MKLNKTIWKNENEFYEAYNIFLKTKKRKLKNCEIKFSNREWSSLTGMHKSIKSSNIKQGIFNKKRKKKNNKNNKNINYKKYLLSKEWKEKKNFYIFEVNNICQCCKKQFEYKNLVLHHHNYKNVGKEKIEDLVVICNKCHYDIHFEKGVKVSLKEDILKARFKKLEKISYF